MLKKLSILAVLLVLASAVVSAQSAKNAVNCSNVALVPSYTESTGDWVTVVGNPDAGAADAVTIHCAQQKDLVFGYSVECGLHTRTRVRSKGGVEDMEYASAGVRVRILVDPASDGTIIPGVTRIAEPGSDPTEDGNDDTGVTYCFRKQQLSAKLQGIIENLACFPDGVWDPLAEGCELADEEIELVLETMDASAFFFVLDDLGSGDHNIIVQAKIDTAVSSADADASGLLGRGSLIVEEVRMVKNAGVLTP